MSWQEDSLRSGKNLVICLVATIMEFSLLDHLIPAEIAYTAGDACIQMIEEATNPEMLTSVTLACLYRYTDLIEENRHSNHVAGAQIRLDIFRPVIITRIDNEYCH